MKNFLIILLCLVVLYHGRAQKSINPADKEYFAITVNHNEFTIKTQMLAKDKKIHPKNNLSYLWYTSQSIIETMGGYNGRLIHGPYSSFYLNNQLREQGRIRYGLKDGLWKYWYEDGHLKEIIKWKNGRKHGEYKVFNDRGQIMAKGVFKNDKLHGKFVTYGPANTPIDVRRYKYGNEVIKKKKEPRKSTKDRSNVKEKTKKERKTKLFQRKNKFSPKKSEEQTKV